MTEGSPDRLDEHVRVCGEIMNEMGRVLVGQEAMVQKLLVV